MKRFYWLLLFWILTIASARIADAQKAFPGIDSAEKLISKTRTAITSGTTITAGSPYKIAITLGDGAKFLKVTPKPFIVMIESSSPTDLTPIEEFRVSAVSNDTLTLIARSPAVGHNLAPQTWSSGSRISVAIAGEYIKSLQDTLNWLITSGPGVGTVTSIVFQSPLTGGTITSSGTVTIPMATASTSGYLSSANFSTFNSKQATISTTSPLLLSGANISIVQSDATHAGYISSTDWNTFNDKYSLADTTAKTGQVLTVLASGTVDWSSAGSGSVSSVNVSGGTTGLTFSGGPITSSGTMTITSGALTLGFGGTGAATAAQARVNILPDTTGETGKYLRVLAGGGIVWDTASGSGGGGSGTVTSADISVPSFLSVSGNPITTSGTFAVTLSGSALPYSSGGTGQTTWTKGDLLYASNTNTLSKLGVGSTGQILTVASGLPSWATSSAGTVTSVAAAGPAGILTWSSAVTSSGTLTATIASQSANMVLASPDGSSGTPSFRSLVAGDIPSLDVAQITSGSFSVARGGTGRATLTANDLVIGNGTSAVTLLAAGGSNTVLSGSTTPSYVTLAVDATLVGDGIGTSFGLDLTHANTWTGAPTVNKANILATYTDGLSLTNTTAADVSNTVQQSPSLKFTANVWNTTSTATDSIETWRVTNVPTSGASTTSKLLFDNGNTGGGYTNVASLSDAGAFNVLTGGSYQINGTSVLNATTLGSGITASSLTSVGTIATGVWHGTAVGAQYGGTGLNSSAASNGQLLIGNGSGLTLAAPTGTANQITVTTGSGTLAFSTPQDIATSSSPTFAGLNLGSGTLSTVGNIRLDTSANRTIQFLATSSGGTSKSLTITGETGAASTTGGTIAVTGGDGGSGNTSGGTVTISGGDGKGTNGGAGSLLLKSGTSTGNAAGVIAFYLAMGGSSGSTTRTPTEMAYLNATSATAVTLGIGLSAISSSTLQMSAGSSIYALIHPVAHASSLNYTIRDAGADGDFLFETSDLHATGSLITSTATRGVLSSVAIGSTNDILQVVAGVPTWTTNPSLTGLSVTNATTLSGSLNVHVSATKTTTYTILISDCVVVCDPTGGAFTATLPTGSTAGQIVIVSKIDGGVNAVTVAPGAGQTIIAATGVLSGGNVSLTTTDPTAHLCYIGTNNWILISRD